MRRRASDAPETKEAKIMSGQNKSIRSIFNILFIIVLVTAWLGAAPNTARAAAEQSPSLMPTNNCNGTGFMRSLTLTQSLGPTDDESTGLVPLGFSVNYFGNDFTHVYINNNGNLTFAAPSGNHNWNSAGLAYFSVPVIAPFYADVDTIPGGSPNLVYYDQVTVGGHPAFAVHWDHVGYYERHVDKTNDFMVILIDRSDRAAGDFDIEFDYGQVQWETGDASSGSGGLGGFSAIIGFASSITSLVEYQAPGSLIPGSFLDSNATTGAVHTALNSTHCGQWVFQVEDSAPLAESWEVTSLDGIGCNAHNTDFMTMLSNVTFPTTLRFLTLVDASGTRYMDQDAGVPFEGNGSYVQQLLYDNSGGPAANAWPIPDNTPITVQFQLINGAGGPPVTDYMIHLTKCNDGTFMRTFDDVPLQNWALSWIYRLYFAGITTGCSASPLLYCPDDTVTRAQMAVFLERGMRGAAYNPPAGTGTVFTDVPLSYWADNWIEKLSADGITNGCGSGIYCPDDPVTRAQMAKFLLIAKHGSGYTPPAPTGIFPDVPISNWAAGWIEELYHENITSGCGNGNYCPDANVTRDQMAKFLVLTFNLPLY